jgi:hypothetical protein
MSQTKGQIKFERLIQLSGIDFHVFHTLVLRSWGVIAGGVTILLIPIGLTPELQGYYYAFASILALQIFFELGLNQVIIQLVSHDAAYIQLTKNDILEGSVERVNRLNGLVNFIRRWYAFVAITFALIVGPAGWFFFANRSQEIPIIDWLPAWFILVGLTAVNLYLSPRLAIVEGTGAVGNIARLRLLQSIIGNAVLWALLLCGAQLWATIAIPLISIICTSAWLGKKALWMKKSRGNSLINWKRDILPLQWRISLSWMSGYVLFNLFTPIVFSIHGPVEAGRLGLAISIYGAVTGLGMSWVAAKSPLMTMHISRGESSELNYLFKNSAVQSTIFTSLLACVVYIVVCIANSLDLSIANRIAVPATLFWMAISSIINTLIFAAATYMRAHREEPMLMPSIVGAILTLFAVFITKDNVTNMMMAVAFLNTMVGLPWTIFLLKRYWDRHAGYIKA